MADGVNYKTTDSRLIEIERTWSPGDKLRVKIPLDIRIAPHGDKTLNSVAFVRGPQVLAADTDISADGGIPESGWWGDTVYTQAARQNGIETEFQLVPFADAGQNKEDYAVLHDGVEISNSD